MSAVQGTAPALCLAFKTIRPRPPGVSETRLPSAAVRPLLSTSCGPG